MTGIFRSKSLSFKDMPQMRAAIRTDNFDSSAVRVRMPVDGSRNGIVEAGPPASRVKFVV